ncbi:transcriptional regulator domain-containing protein [Rhizorhapis sp. SPR117]|uniref:transcriptional regulator domain-containing protein n=1 Tax=Rhizorhapis sp. SPR117 TaxID=2912611 RepID=UPI001F173F15|nr:DUF6499 domain-containing protein [Rhizorhapis sp. SPR117]
MIGLSAQGICFERLLYFQKYLNLSDPGVASHAPDLGGDAMLSIDWRLPAAYRYAKHIPTAGFAWEYLRRNDDYRQDFRTIALTGRPTGRDLKAFADRWGLRFPVRSRHAA